MIALTAILLAAADGGAPLDLSDDVKLLFDTVTCQHLPMGEMGGKSMPDAGARADYCKKLLPRFDRFRQHWGVSGASQFLQSVEPRELPTELVYPFGGGDLMMALSAFPKAQVITTLSLELAGDPRRLKTLKDDASLEKSLHALLEASNSTLLANDSKSTNLSAIQQGELPGQLAMHLFGLALFEQMPLSARYFKIENDGTLHYYSKEEIDALDGQKAKNLDAKWLPPDFSPAFANVEITFVPKGQPNATPRIFRHIAADLSDAGLKANPGVLAHLNAKGLVASMTKAASYLLWREEFSMIRKYLTAHSRFMVSDSTGVLPRFWPKSCAFKTYGAFDKTFLGTWEVYQSELAKVFVDQPRRALPMRFGYPDGSPEKKSHMVTVECP
jgi:hypothetical protein